MVNRKEDKISVGDKFGCWKVLEKIGGGGHGEVWKAEDDALNKVAIKFLKKPSWSKKIYQRFQDEVKIQVEVGDIEQVLPVIDCNVPDKPTLLDRPWLVMPLADPISKNLSSTPPFSSIVELIYDLTCVLTELHQRGVSHRDIKPDNLFYYGNKYTVGDFGLVDYPEKRALTSHGRKLGPMYYIAPEMLNSPTGSDGKKADVYSLAKVFWKLVSGLNFPVPGEHRLNSNALSLSYYTDDERAFFLDGLIVRATKHDPNERITMHAFKQELENWMKPKEITMEGISIPCMSDLIQRFEDKQYSDAQEITDLTLECNHLADELRKRIDSILEVIEKESGLLTKHYGGLNPLTKNPYYNVSDVKKQVTRQGMGFAIRVPKDSSQLRVHGEFCASQIGEKIFCSFEICIARGAMSQPKTKKQLHLEHWIAELGTTKLEEIILEVVQATITCINQGVPEMRDILLSEHV